MLNNKILSLIAMLLLLCVFSVSCSDESDVPEGMKELSNDSNAYNFYVYTQWIVDEQNTQCAYYSSADRSNVSMSAYVPDSSFETVEQYYRAYVEQYREELPDFTVVDENSDAEMFRYNAYKLVYTFTFGKQTFKVMQVMTLHQGIIYIFTYTSSPDYYDLHINEAEQMLAEITFDS